ncbi:C40 family peptidase [Paenibacillus aestuarii]|uniref:NlpC/P60 family protein n=1 Tax=Paenibacillus aestuarii TaxID=516965 RepID=A0ABW0KHD9_9BACL|nr:C40 family peptidase [Paenibacillus aestuarii]
MWKRLKSTAVGGMAVILATTTGCGSDYAQPKPTTPAASPSIQQGTRSLSQAGQGVNMLSTNPASGNAIIPIKAIGNVNYVSANDLIKLLRFQTDWDSTKSKLMIGDNDANFELIVNSNRAIKEDNVIHLSQPIVKEGDTVYIPVSALGDLFQDDMSFDVMEHQVSIHPTTIPVIEHEGDPDPDPSSNSPELDFADDPNDPFKGNESATNPASIENLSREDLEVWAQSVAPEAIPVLKNINLNAVINKGEQYMGVKYKFGTGPYPQTGKFDCSTFTQYVFGKYGVKLPRVARQQATVGSQVSRKSLRKGDLMFFYVPGRFRTNKTVGHVGIYMGNNKMLHASPEPKNGVQISNINIPYWKKTFLRAKRVAT